MKFQDAMCVNCGWVFRVRAHQRECVDADPNPKVVDLAHELHTAHFNSELRDEAPARSDKADKIPLV
jgi:hypothetical protein